MEIKKKKICLILPGKLPVPNILGGAIETLLTLLVDQNEKYNKVHFIVISPWADGVDEISRQYKNSEFYYFRIRTGIWKRTINFINYVIARTIGIIDFLKTPMHHDIEKIIRRIDADYVVVEHAVYKHFEFLNKYYSRNQLYLHLHGLGPMPDKGTVKTFGHVITVSEFIKESYINSFASFDTKFHVCLNGIDDSNFKKKITKDERKRIRQSFGVEDEDFLIIYCGRLVYEKGVKELIRAVLDTKKPHIKLMIIGGANFEGANKTRYVYELESMIKKNEGQIFLTGFITNSNLYRYYQSADLQVICSICEEAAGLVVVEGMMSGLPQIVTDSGGIKEYIDPNSSTGIKKHASLNNEIDRSRLSEQLSKTISDLYNQYKNNKSKLIFPKISANNFDAKHFYDRFVGIFE